MLLGAIIFALSVPDASIASISTNASELHLAYAGIYGTVLALVLSLSILPAQRAAEAFFSGILRLYAPDRTLLRVVALLSGAAMMSIVFGSGWTFGVSTKYALATQFFAFGSMLDALRAFYARALDLLVPATALELVRKECYRHIERAKHEIERLVRIYNLSGETGADDAITRWLFYSQTQISRPLIAWISQLEEFGHKALARRDTQAANAIMKTVASVGMKYAESRRDSLVLLPDWSSPIPIAVSDIGMCSIRFTKASKTYARTPQTSRAKPSSLAVFGLWLIWPFMH